MASPKADGHPFTDSTADIIFCSSDNVHFRLHKIILSLASDFFKDMFSLPQPILLQSPAPCMPLQSSTTQTDDIEGLPLVHVTEPSVVLQSLFRLCYPIADPPLQTIEQVRPTLEAALKYQMQEAIDITTQSLLGLVQTAPLRVFAIACRLSLHKVIGVAALAVREQNLQHSYVEELEDISVDAYHQLLKFCEPPAPHLVLGVPFPSAPPSNLIVPPSALGAPKWSSFTRARPIPPHMADLQGAEVIIQTSDSVQFGVFESILNLSSDVWRKTILNARSTTSVSPFILHVQEHSNVILPLLELCYPISQPSLTSIEQLPALIIAAKKYDMVAATEALVRALWRLVNPPPRVPGCDPLLAYFAGCQLDMRGVAQAAAARTLRTDIVKRPRSGAESFDVAAGHLWRLLEYHRRCRAAVRAVVEDDQWITEAWRKKKPRSCPRSSVDMPCWWKTYLAAIAKEPWPRSTLATSEAVLQETAMPTGFQAACTYCSNPDGMLLLFSISKHVAETMEARESEVRLEWITTAEPSIQVQTA